MEGVLDQLESANGAEEEEKQTPLIDPFAMSQCEFSDRDKTQYRIYENETDYTLLEASTAAEAIQKADGKPYKVLRESMDNYSALPRQKVAIKEDGTILYSDPQLSEPGKRPDFATFDVASFQAEPDEFHAFDYIALAGAEEGDMKAAEAPAKAAQPVVQSEVEAAPTESLEEPVAEAASETTNEGADQTPDDDEPLSPEEVAELLGESE